MDKLPKVYANPIDKNFSNVQDVYQNDYDRKEIISPQNVNKKINEIFASSSHVYKSKVRIKFKDHSEEVIIVGKTNLNLLTIEGKLIRIIDIIDIERI